MTAKDKQTLFAGKCIVDKYFAKRKALKRINELLKNAESILNTHPAIEFNNFFENELLKTKSIISAEEAWSAKVNDVLTDLFGAQSDILQQFSQTLVKNELSKYAGVRNQLEAKLSTLNKFKEDLMSTNK
jgi:hypothetical protein